MLFDTRTVSFLVGVSWCYCVGIYYGNSSYWLHTSEFIYAVLQYDRWVVRGFFQRSGGITKLSCNTV